MKRIFDWLKRFSRSRKTPDVPFLHVPIEGGETRPFPPEFRDPENLKWDLADEKSKMHLGFSLVEVLAAVALIGIITFLALPNIVRIKQDSEESLAISRAEALNLAMSSFVQAHGQTAAATEWSGASSNDDRYDLLAPYLAFAPDDLASYMPGGYSATLPSTLLPLDKVDITGPGGAVEY